MSRSLLALIVLTSLAAPAAADDVDPLYTCKALPGNAMVAVSIKPDASLIDLATWVAGFTCKNVVYDSGVTKYATKLTVITPAKMTVRQAIALFVDAVQATGLVVKQKPDTIIISLGPNMPRTCPDVPAEAPAYAVGPSPGSPGILVDELDAGIKEISPTEHTIKRDLRDKLVANPMALAKGARVMPSAKNGAPVGIKLYAIRPSSIWRRVGLMNGDTLMRINGMELTSADKALEVYTKIREAKTLTIDIQRRGQPLVLVIKIVD
jgi:hypothetical protein